MNKNGKNDEHLNGIRDPVWVFTIFSMHILHILHISILHWKITGLFDSDNSDQDPPS
jgi:hypothetical protein